MILIHNRRSEHNIKLFPTKNCYGNKGLLAKQEHFRLTELTYLKQQSSPQLHQEVLLFYSSGVQRLNRSSGFNVGVEISTKTSSVSTVCSSTMDFVTQMLVSSSCRLFFHARFSNSRKKFGGTRCFIINSFLQSDCSCRNFFLYSLLSFNTLQSFSLSSSNCFFNN